MCWLLDKLVDYVRDNNFIYQISRSDLDNYKIIKSYDLDSIIHYLIDQYNNVARDKYILSAQIIINSDIINYSNKHDQDLLKRLLYTKILNLLKIDPDQLIKIKITKLFIDKTVNNTRIFDQVIEKYNIKADKLLIPHHNSIKIIPLTDDVIDFYYK